MITIMKNLYFVLLLGCVVYLISGCKKDTTQTANPPPADLPVIHITPDSSVVNVNYNGSLTVQWDVVGSYESFTVTLNGKFLSNDRNGNKTCDSLKVDQSFVFVAKSANGWEASKYLKIKVRQQNQRFTF
jgi:hypothetical protein